MSRKRKATFTDAQTVDALDAKGVGAAWAVSQGGNPGDHFEERVITDLVFKLRFWGSLSEKQWTFLGNLLKQIAERPAKEAAAAAERAAAAPVPVTSERITIVGEVLCFKLKCGRFGDQLKMLVKTVDGFKVWGTVPASLTNAAKGDTVSFEALIARSADDDKFGFFSRPTKGAVIVSKDGIDLDAACAA